MTKCGVNGFLLLKGNTSLPDVSTSRHRWKFWSPLKNRISQSHAIDQLSLPEQEMMRLLEEYKNLPKETENILVMFFLNQFKGTGNKTWIRSAISAPILSYLWAIDMTRRTLLIANFSLAKQDSINLECNSAREILNEVASCSSEGSHPSLSLSLECQWWHNRNKISWIKR